MLLSLGLSYWLCRFVFFDLHGMKSWPTALASFGLSVIVIAIIFNLSILGLAAVVGYLVGFILAMLFNTASLDPGGGTLNNAWIIWGAVFIISLLLGFTLDVISRHKGKTFK